MHSSSGSAPASRGSRSWLRWCPVGWQLGARPRRNRLFSWGGMETRRHWLPFVNGTKNKSRWLPSLSRSGPWEAASQENAAQQSGTGRQSQTARHPGCCPSPARVGNGQHQHTLQAASTGTVGTLLSLWTDSRPRQCHRTVTLLCIPAGRVGCPAPKPQAPGKAKLWVRFWAKPGVG